MRDEKSADIFSPVTAVAGNNIEGIYPKRYKDIPLPFSFLVAREVRHPLTTIALSIEMLESVTDNTTQTKCRSLIKRSYLRINNLMELLLEHEGKDEKLVKPYSIHKLLDEVLEININMISLN